MGEIWRLIFLNFFFKGGFCGKRVSVGHDTGAIWSPGVKSSDAISQANGSCDRRQIGWKWSEGTLCGITNWFTTCGMFQPDWHDSVRYTHIPQVFGEDRCQYERPLVQCCLTPCWQPHTLAALGEDDAVRDARRRLREKRCKEGDEEAGDQMTKERFQLPPKRCNVFCFVECAWQPVPEGASQHCRMTSRPSAFSLCSHWIQRCLVCTRKKSGENEMDCMGKQVPVYIVQIHARTGTWDRGFCIQSVWR